MNYFFLKERQGLKASVAHLYTNSPLIASRVSVTRQGYNAHHLTNS